MKTQDFATRTVITDCENETADGYWNFALDIGYSGVKGMSPNRMYCFPGFARPMRGKMIDIGDASERDILYKDETGNIWAVGASAQDNLSSRDTNDSLRSLYGRDRYYTPMFLVIARTGMGIGMMANKFGDPNGKTPVLQTGLPPRYLEEDAIYMKDVLGGRHVFDLKIGKKPWQHFDFELPADNIRITQQPMGTFLGMVIDNHGHQTADAKDYLNGNVLIFDAGFGTLDMFSIRSRQMENEGESFDDLGMKAVLDKTSEELFRQYKVKIPVYAIQQSLRRGYVVAYDRKAMKTSQVEFGNILKTASDAVCNEAVERMMSLYGNMIDYDHLIITGGTGAAWIDNIRNKLSGIETLKIEGANKNDDIPYIFANVRGYYVYQTGALRVRKK